MDLNEFYENMPVISAQPSLLEKIKAFHMWWATLPLGFARVAIYTALLGTEATDLTFIRSLCEGDITDQMINRARQKIGETHKVKNREFEGLNPHVRENEVSSDEGPKILDIFAGTGVIPSEASRLGCQSYSIELNPVGYLIQLCSLVFPERFGIPDPNVGGSAPDGTWAGLANEILYWSEWVHCKARSELNWLYSPIPGSAVGEGIQNELIPTAYLWTTTVKCQSRSCGSIFPLLSDPWLARRRSGLSSAIFLDSDENKIKTRFSVRSILHDAGATIDPIATISRGMAKCPFCMTEVSTISVAEQVASRQVGVDLMAVACRNGDTKYVYVNGAKAAPYMPSETDVRDQLNKLIIETKLTVPEEPIVYGMHSRLKQFGLVAFKQLFTRRQLLTLLTYTNCIHFAYGKMLSMRYSPEFATAIAAYLGLLLARLAGHNSRLVGWNNHIETFRPTFARGDYVYSHSFAEQNPFHAYSGAMPGTKSIVDSVKSVKPSIKIPEIHCVSATNLPFVDNYFDAIVTHPPYYDDVCYSDLSDFYYIWLKRSIGHLFGEVFSSALSPKEKEIVVAPERFGGNKKAAIENYEQLMSMAVSEANRVLKPGCYLTIIVVSKTAEDLQAFINMCQAAGLELFDAKKMVQEYAITRPEAGSRGLVTLTFKKNVCLKKVPLALTNARRVLDLVNEGRRPLYSGLTDFLIRNVGLENLVSSIPDDYRGSDTAKLKEYVADCHDPATLLKDLLGDVGLIIAAKKLQVSGKNPVEALKEILQYFGFNVPEPPCDGIFESIGKIRRMLPQISKAREKNQIKGIFLDVMSLLERTILRATLAWGQAIFENDKDKCFEEILNSKEPREDRNFSRLSMGDKIKIFLWLPEWVVKSEYAERTLQLLGRPHPYKSKKFAERLQKATERRNTIDHNKNDYMVVTPLPKLKDELGQDVKMTLGLMDDLKESGAVPIIVKAVSESVDMWGRRKISLDLEDETTKEIYCSFPVQLGTNYFFLGQENNPRPVDPLICSLSETLTSKINS